MVILKVMSKQGSSQQVQYFTFRMAGTLEGNIITALFVIFKITSKISHSTDIQNSVRSIPTSTGGVLGAFLTTVHQCLLGHFNCLSAHYTCATSCGAVVLSPFSNDNIDILYQMSMINVYVYVACFETYPNINMVIINCVLIQNTTINILQFFV